MQAFHAVMRGVVCPDDFRVVAGVYQPELDVRAACIEAWSAICRRSSEAVLLVGPPAAGKSTWLEQHHRGGVAYYDATLTHGPTRAQLCRIARECNLPVTVIVFAAPLSECLRRNALRDGPRRVPDARLAGMWQALQDDPPRPRDGVSVVYA